MLPTFCYVVASICFVIGIKRMSRVRTARSGNTVAAVGMLLAVVGVLAQSGTLSWWMLISGLLIGGGLGSFIAYRVPMTSMPELVAVLHGGGGAASALVALAKLMHQKAEVTDFASFVHAAAVPLTILVATLTISGSVIGYYKLQGRKLVHPLKGSMRHGLHALLALVGILLATWLIYADSNFAIVTSVLLLIAVAGALGWLLILPIGGADMPVVVSLLNSYAGIAGCFSGFVIGNQLLIVAGALVGSSGIILSLIMCRAMNRSLGNVLLGGIGDDAGTIAKDAEYTGVKSSSSEEVAMLLDGATSCIMVPGYGLAVAQAQHAMRELGDILEERGCKVRYAIHPVAGRMPGHMNVLLAEADVSYDKLYEMDAINGDFANTDVVLVVGANDVVNPSARSDKGSPIYGMPILDVDEARTVVVIKRGLSPGYAGVKNTLFERDNCVMYFQDAKQGLEQLLSEVKSL